MNNRPYRGVLISDFNTGNLVNLFNNDAEVPAVHVLGAPFDQVLQSIMQDDKEFWKIDPDFVFLWTMPQSVITSFRKILKYEQSNFKLISEEVSEYVSRILQLKERTNSIFIATWWLPSYNRGYGFLDMRNNLGIANILMRMNLTLADKLEKHSNFYLLNTQKWTEYFGEVTFNQKLWYMGKIPFHHNVFKNAVKDIKAGLNAICGNTRKLIIVDLDDTLWGGTVGDLGWENIRLGGHDSIGEAFLDFQRELKNLKNRGILLGIVSKNEDNIAIEAIQKNPEMVLTLEDFAGWRINWNDKAQNIVELVKELNLGLQSVVFIDDNPFERARVSEALPEVAVPEWPDDKFMFRKYLQSLTFFDSVSISQEDTNRAKMYLKERNRQELKRRINSLEEWLATLNIVVTIEEFSDSNFKRTNQLLNKTNQMNLSTRRLNEKELADWVSKPNRRMWTFRVSDQFGDSGLTGIASIFEDKNVIQIIDFVLSCRVMGRGIEETMIYTIVNHAKEKRIKFINAIFSPTNKNKPCLDFLRNSGFVENDKYIFTRALDKDYCCPEHVTIVKC